MAEKLSDFDWSTPSHLTKSDEKAVYPWDDWLDGDIWRLTRGEDFEPHPLMMERVIRTRASGRKHDPAKVRIRHLPLNGSKDTADPTGVIVLERTDKLGPKGLESQTAAAKKEQKAEARRKRDAERRAEKKAAAKKAPSKKAARPK